MKNDDLAKQFHKFLLLTDKALKKFPVLAANVAVNFFQDSFKQQGFSGDVQEVWAKRKLQRKGDAGRAILVKTGRLKRSIKTKQATWAAVVVGTDVPYAGIHNDGFRGNVTVSEHSRIATRKVATRYSSKGKALKTGIKKIQGKGHQVSSFTRKVNMPRRRFIGNSPYLNKDIERTFIVELNKIKT